MDEQTQTILCGACRIPVEGPANPKAQDMISCPTCGRSDNFENVMRSVEACITELTSHHLQKTIRETVGRHKFIKITTKPVPHGNHPFVVDLKL